MAPEPTSDEEEFMPLLMCPNDNVAMQTANRSGVEFDFCPSCRGVWLDRGELEKLMSSAREADEGPVQARPREYDRDDDRDRSRWNDDDYRRKKRRGFDIFDIFD
jgi:Zn-finger nucleic acid-binding protein